MSEPTLYKIDKESLIKLIETSDKESFSFIKTVNQNTFLPGIAVGITLTDKNIQIYKDSQECKVGE